MGNDKGRLNRYDLAEARDLGQRGEPPAQARKSRNVEIDTVAIADPAAIIAPAFDAKGKRSKAAPRLIATVNRRVDILEYELSHRRISADAYAEGRFAQALFERSGLGGGSTWSNGSRVDAEVAKEIAILRKISDARVIKAMLADLRRALGTVDAELVRQVLGENRKYADVVLPQRMATDKTPAERGVGYIAQRFRDALETLARESRRR